MDSFRHADERGVSPVDSSLISPAPPYGSPHPQFQNLEEKRPPEQWTTVRMMGPGRQDDRQLGCEYDEYLLGYGNGFEYDSAQGQHAGSGRPPSSPSFGGWFQRRPAREYHADKVRHWWWWWEIGAAALSTASMTLILAVLATVNDKPLATWPLPIQPNSLIAVLTTVGKSAMMVTVSSCISQLKWRYFRTGAHPLSHLQSFDDASRGPWGAIAFFLHVHFQALLVCSLALVTLIGMGIEPTTQQLLDFPPGLSILANVSPTIGQARAYESKAYALLHQGDVNTNLANALFHPETVQLETALINGAIGVPSTRQVNCPPPATQCSWPDITTMGYCYTFSNLTDIMATKCTLGNNGTDENNKTCVFDYPGRQLDDPTISMQWILNKTASGSLIPSKYTFLTSLAGVHTDSIGGTEVSLTVARVTDDTLMGKGLNSPPVELLYSRWYLCEHTLRNVSSVLGTTNIGNITREALSPVRNETQLPESLKNSTTFIPDYTVLTYRANTSGNEYSIMQRPPIQISNYLAYMLSNTYALNLVRDEVTDSIVSGTVLGNNNLLPFGYFLNSTDLHNTTANIADTLSAQMQSASPGDNANLTLISGVAQISETYVAVRWGWILLPLLESLLTIVLLVVTIYRTYSEPLYKTSIIAPLALGLVGWDADEQARLREVGTAEGLVVRSRDMVTRFVQDPAGRVGFMKAAG